MIRSVFERRLQGGGGGSDSRHNSDAGSVDRRGKVCGQMADKPASGQDKSEDCEDDLYFEMEFPVINRSSCDGGESSYHSDSYGSQSTLDSRDSPYRDDYGRERSQGPRERPNSLRIPTQSDYNNHNAFYSLPREKVVGAIPRINLQNFSVPVTPADNWIKEYLDTGEEANCSSYVQYGPQSLTTTRSKSRLSLNLGDSRSSSPNKSRSISRILRSSFSRLWGGGGSSGSGGGSSKDKARTPEPVMEAEPLSLPGPMSTKSSPRPESRRSLTCGARPESRKSWASITNIMPHVNQNQDEGSERSESPVTPITEEIVQQSIAKGLPIIPFACSSATVIEEKRKQRSAHNNHLQSQMSHRDYDECPTLETVPGGSSGDRSPGFLQDRSPSGYDRSPGVAGHYDRSPGVAGHYDRSPGVAGHYDRSLVGASHHDRSPLPGSRANYTQYLDANVTPRLTTSAPASRKTSRKESKLVDYIYNHQSDGITRPKSQISDTTLEEEKSETLDEESCSVPPQHQEDRSLNSLLLRAKLELEQEMERRKDAQARRLRGYAANNSRALERRRSSDNMYVMMSLDNPPDSAHEVTEDYDSDDVFEKEEEQGCLSMMVPRCGSVQNPGTNSPVATGCGSYEDEVLPVQQDLAQTNAFNITKIMSTSPNNNNDKNFPNSNIEIRVVSDQECELNFILGGESGGSTKNTSPATSVSPQLSGSPMSPPLQSAGYTPKVGSLKSASSSPRSRTGTTTMAAQSSGTVSPRSDGSSVSSKNMSDYLRMDVGHKFCK